jgi:hypothetical protein
MFRRGMATWMCGKLRARRSPAGRDRTQGFIARVDVWNDCEPCQEKHRRRNRHDGRLQERQGAYVAQHATAVWRMVRARPRSQRGGLGADHRAQQEENKQRSSPEVNEPCRFGRRAARHEYHLTTDVVTRRNASRLRAAALEGQAPPSSLWRAPVSGTGAFACQPRLQPSRALRCLSID